MRIWVAITAYSPTSRIPYLRQILQNYADLNHDVEAHIYCDFEAQHEHYMLTTSIKGRNADFELHYCSPSWQGYRLTWAHKEDLKEAILNKKADLYIYQEDDIDLKHRHIEYYLKYRKVLKPLGLTPGFTRFEKWNSEIVPFDNQEIHPLNGKTRNIWGPISFPVNSYFVNNSDDILVFSQLQNPYYAAMILDQEEADEYIESPSFDEHKSAEVISYRGWPVADRSSMGTAFNNVPKSHRNLQHKRAVALSENLGIHPSCLIEHFGTKYSEMLINNHKEILNYKEIFKLE